MMEIIMTVLILIGMARRGRPRRRMGRYLRGAVDEQLTLTTLASKTAVAADFDSVVNERTLVSSVVARYSMTAFTKSTGDGPILVGLAHSDYSTTEIEEYIEQTESWNEGNLIAKEVGQRKIRRIGVFENPIDEAAAVVLNDGKAIKTKMNWILLQGQTVQVWAYNMGSSPLATTAPVIDVQGHANLFPK